MKIWERSLSWHAKSSLLVSVRKSSMGSLDGQAHEANRSCTKVICTICEELLAVNTWNWNLLNDLDWPSLQSRRKVARLSMLHKTIHGESALEIPSYIRRRNFWHLRSYHQDKFIELKSNTKAYKTHFIVELLRNGTHCLATLST